jgi:hypothetical protein
LFDHYTICFNESPGDLLNKHAMLVLRDVRKKGAQTLFNDPAIWEKPLGPPAMICNRTTFPVRLESPSDSLRTWADGCKEKGRFIEMDDEDISRLKTDIPDENENFDAFPFDIFGMAERNEASRFYWSSTEDPIPVDPQLVL